jgi:phosphatidylserine/phosphatidylglycerophosphate/cardiolipin synthase-like enzyme
VNDEITVAVADADLAATLTSHFNDDLLRSKKLDAKTWKDQRSMFGKAQELFWSLFDEVF